jgi:YNFM family putative membrane transporter
MIATGALAEAWGRKRTMVVSLAASSIMTMLAALAPNWPALLILRALAGLTLSGLPAVAMAYLGDEMATQALGFAMGLYIAGSTLGGMSGRLVVAALSDLVGWRPAIAAAGSVGLVGAALIALGLPAARETVARRPDMRSLIVSVAGHFAEPGLRLLFAEAFLLMGAFVCAYNYFGFRLAEPPFSLSQTMIGLVFVLYLVGAVSSTVMGDLAGRYGRRRVLWIAIAVELVGLAATLPNNLVAIVAGIGLITWGFFGAHSIASSWVGLRTQTARAQASALYLFFYYLGSSVVGSAGGLFFQRLGWNGVAGLLAVLTGCALLIALRLSKVPPPAHLRGP